MTGIFRANNPINTFLLFVYGLLLKFAWMLHPAIPAEDISYGFLYNHILAAIKPFLDPQPVSYFVIAYLFLFTQAISINQLVTSRKLMQKPNYLPAMSYLLITSFMKEWNTISPALIAGSILIWVLFRMTSLNSNRHVKSTLFNIGMAIGICSFLIVPSLVFTLFVIFSLVIIRPPKAAEWFITIIGVATPWYFCFAWLFFTNKLYSFYIPGFGFSYPVYKAFTPELAGLLSILILTVAGGFYVQSVSSKQVVQVRKSWVLILLYFLFSLSLTAICRQYTASCWLVALAPAAAFCGSAFFYLRMRWIPAVVQWLLAGLIFYIQYFQK